MSFLQKVTKVNWFYFLLVTSYPYVLYFRETDFNIIKTLPYNVNYASNAIYEINEFGLSDVYKRSH